MRVWFKEEQNIHTLWKSEKDQGDQINTKIINIIFIVDILYIKGKDIDILGIYLAAFLERTDTTNSRQT